MLTVGLGAWSQDCECLQGKVASKYSSGGLGGRGGGRGREKGKPEEEDNAVCYCVALAVLWNREGEHSRVAVVRATQPLGTSFR